MKKEPTVCDGSAILTGVLLAFNLPSNLPVWIILIGALAAIGIGKMSFGGLGNNIFNPALVGRVFLLISFPAQMTMWPEVGQLTAYTDVTTGATVLSLMNEGALDKLPALVDMLFGKMGGSLGEVSALALLLGLVFMLWKKIITWQIPVSILLTVLTLIPAFSAKDSCDNFISCLRFLIRSPNSISSVEIARLLNTVSPFLQFVPTLRHCVAKFPEKKQLIFVLAAFQKIYFILFSVFYVSL